jgi:hypothetical protein
VCHSCAFSLFFFHVIRPLSYLAARALNAHAFSRLFFSLSPLQVRCKIRFHKFDTDPQLAKIYSLHQAPEVLRGEPDSEAASCYNFGVLCWEILNRKPLIDLFGGSDDDATIEQVRLYVTNCRE